MLEQAEQLKASLKILRSEERRIKASIKERTEYYRQQEDLIKQMIDVGNNTLRNLVYEEEDMRAQMVLMKEEIIDTNALLIEKRYELALYGKALENYQKL